MTNIHGPSPLAAQVAPCGLVVCSGGGNLAVGGTGEDDRYSTGSLIKATQAHNAGIKPGPVDCPLVMYVLY